MSPEEIAMISSFLSGGLVVCVASHFLAASKESRDRKNDFRGFLGRWFGRIIQERDTSKAYTDWLQDFWGYYGKLYRDFCCKSTFRDLCHDLGSLKPEDIQKDAERYRGIITEKIQALIDYV